MTSLLRDVRSHPAASLVFLLLWFTVLAATVVTWQIDPAGHSVGMSPGAIPLHLILPLLLGGLVGWWQRASPGSPTRACAAAGLAFGAVHFLALALVDGVWIPSPERALAPADFWLEAAGFGAAYLAIAAALGVVGGKAQPLVTNALAGS